MKIIAALMIVLALVIAVVPQFTSCAAHGLSLKTADGRSVPMKCHWTAQAEMAVAAPLLIAGLLQLRSKRKEGQINLGVMGAALGVFVVLLPTALVGVCANPEMICNAVMKPALIFTGTMVTMLNLGAIFMAVRKDEGQWAYSA